MSDLVTIASTAVSAYQRALGTVSNNIANVGTEGYSKQEVGLIENSPRDYGTSFIGTGVNVTGVRRLYDAFIEDSLRNATAELETQGPMVEYANRVVNILGNENVSLLSAFEEFFDATRQLSSDASSLVLRTQFLSKAEGLAARFGELNGQLELVNEETQERLKSDINELNQLAEQLNTVNLQLRKTRYLDRQPPALLDERDTVLKKMAELAKIRTAEAMNGEVTVSISSTLARGQIVNAEGTRTLSAVFSETEPGKVDMVLDAYSKTPETVNGIAGGSMAGLINFRQRVLSTTMTDLDFLAKATAKELNEIHREGIDLAGNDGLDLFRIDPVFQLQSSQGATNARLGPRLVDLDAYKASPIELAFDANAGQINDLTLTGNFKTGDQIAVTLNGNSRSFTLFDGQLDAEGRPILGTSMELESVVASVKSFLQGGNGSSLDGPFGRQVQVASGAGNDLLVSSTVFGAFSFEISSTSTDGRIENQVNQGLWTAKDLDSGEMVSGVKSLQINGLQIDFSGNPTDGEVLLLTATNRPAAGMSLVLNDAEQVAAASRFRVIENQFNPSGANAQIDETGDHFASETTPAIGQLKSASGTETLDNNFFADEAIRLSGTSLSPLAVIPEGYQNVNLYLGELSDQAIDLQVFTRDGRHIAGRPLADDLVSTEEAALGRALNDDERASLENQAGINFLSSSRLAGANFYDGASYSTQYLNAQDPQAYRGMEVFYGVKAAVEEIEQLNKDHVVGSVDRLAASISSGAIPTSSVALGQTLFSHADLVLNGVELYGLRVEDVDGEARMVMSGLDDNLVLRETVIGESLSLVEGTTDAYALEPSHLMAWLRAQPGWGSGETQTIRFSAPQADGTLTTVLSTAERRISFSDASAAGTLTIDLPPVSTLSASIEVTAGMKAADIARRVEQAFREAGYLEEAEGRRIQSTDEGSLILGFGLTEDDPIVEVNTDTTGLSAQVRETRALMSVETEVEAGWSELRTAQAVADSITAHPFIADFAGRSVEVQDDGSLVIQMALADDDLDRVQFDLGTTGIETNVVKAPGSVGRLGQGEEQQLRFSGASEDGSFYIAGRLVDVASGDSAATVTGKVFDALHTTSGNFVFSESEAGTSTTLNLNGSIFVPSFVGDTDIIADLVITLAGSMTAAEVARHVKEELETHLGGSDTISVVTADGVDAEEATRPWITLEVDDQGRLSWQVVSVERKAFEPTFTVGGDANVEILSTTVTPRYIDEFPGRRVSLNDDGSLTVRFPAQEGDVDTLGITEVLPPGPSEPGDGSGVAVDVDITNFRGLQVALATVFDATGQAIGERFDLTQTPLGLGEEQRLYFGTADASGEIEIAGIKVAIEAGDSGEQVAAKVRQALIENFGSSALASDRAEYVLNGDGSLSVKSALLAGDVRNLEISDAGGTGVSLRSETTAYLPSGENFQSEIRLGLGQRGLSTDLANLGFRTGVYLSGEIKEDLLVFATGQDDGLGFKLGATWKEGSRNAIDTLRAEPFDVVFTSPSQFQILDRNTGTIVAERQYDAAMGIQYRGLTLTLSSAPVAGDRFAVDGNQDGIGNNSNALRIAAVQNRPFLGGTVGQTLADVYGQTVTKVGNASFQASIAERALEVVRDQAVQARDQVSGVSLDEEAADLIRYQQAYQASAKVLQTASLLFDAIIQVR